MKFLIKEHNQIYFAVFYITIRLLLVMENNGHNNEGYESEERSRTHPETPMSPAAFGKKILFKRVNSYYLSIYLILFQLQESGSM